MTRTRSLPKMLSAGPVWLAVLTFIASGCGPVIFRLDETRATGACPWSEDDSGIACVSHRSTREPRSLLLYVPAIRSSPCHDTRLYLRSSDQPTAAKVSTLMGPRMRLDVNSNRRLRVSAGVRTGPAISHTRARSTEVSADCAVERSLSRFDSSFNRLREPSLPSATD
jgi:hypothetical protein